MFLGWPSTKIAKNGLALLNKMATRLEIEKKPLNGIASQTNGPIS